MCITRGSGNVIFSAHATLGAIHSCQTRRKRERTSDSFDDSSLPESDTARPAASASALEAVGSSTEMKTLELIPKERHGKVGIDTLIRLVPN